MNDLPVGVSQQATDDFYVTAFNEQVHFNDAPLEIDASGPLGIAPIHIGDTVADILFGH